MVDRDHGRVRRSVVRGAEQRGPRPGRAPAARTVDAQANSMWAKSKNSKDCTHQNEISCRNLRIQVKRTKNMEVAENNQKVCTLNMFTAAAQSASGTIRCMHATQKEVKRHV